MVVNKPLGAQGVRKDFYVHQQEPEAALTVFRILVHEVLTP